MESAGRHSTLWPDLERKLSAYHIWTAETDWVTGTDLDHQLNVQHVG